MLTAHGRLRSSSCRGMPIRSDDRRHDRYRSRPAAEMGVTLSHEHVLVDFTGADLEPERAYDPDSAVSVILPHLIRLRDLGCTTLVECTPAYLGRNPELLRRLSSQSGILGS